MISINDLLLQRDGVLRFVMEGEMVDGVLPPFSREQLLVKHTVNRGSREEEEAQRKANNIISSLRAELKHGHGKHITNYMQLLTGFGLIEFDYVITTTEMLNRLPHLLFSSSSSHSLASFPLHSTFLLFSLYPNRSLSSLLFSYLSNSLIIFSSSPLLSSFILYPSLL